MQDAASLVRADSASCLEEKLSTLTSALATVTQEKSRIENNFQADKKSMKVF